MKQGYERGQPSSALLNIYGYRRVLRGCGRHLYDMNLVGKILKGLCAQYRQEWGDNAFVRHQCKVMSTTNLHTIANICQNGSIKG